MATHARGRNIKAVCVNFDSMMRARDYFGHDVPMILIVKAVEDSDSITNTDARREFARLAFGFRFGNNCFQIIHNHRRVT
jgi:hypothetical protein